MRGLPVLAAGLALTGALFWLLSAPDGDRRPTEAPEVRAPDDARASETALVPVPQAEPERTDASEASVAAFSFAPSEEAAATTGMLRVVDAVDGTPLPGARVSSRVTSSPFEGETDEGGTLAMPFPAGARTLSMRVEAEGYLIWENALWNKGETELRLWRYGTLSGRVLDAATDTPVAGAHVVYANPLCRSCPDDVAQSDAAGRYRLSVAPLEGKVTLRAVSDDHALQSFHAEVDAASESEWTFDLRLDRGTRIAGVVYDLVDGRPLAGVQLGRELPELTPTTDELGHFELRKLPQERTGSLSLLFSKPGYCPLSASVTRERVADPTPLRFPLVRSAIVAGRIVAEDGTVVSNASVSVVPNPENETVDPPSPIDTLPSAWRFRDEDRFGSASAEDGSYAFDGGLLPWRAGRALMILAEGFEDQLVPLRALEPGEALHQDVVLTPKTATATVHGSVTLNGEKIFSIVSWRGRTQSGQAVTMMQPEYRFEVEPGQVTVTVVPTDLTNDASFEPLAEVSLDVAPGADVTHDFVLELPTRPIQGRVRWDDGRPGADLKVHAQSVANAATRTDGTGQFTLEVVDLGVPYNLLCSSGRIRASQQQVAPGASGVELVLRAPGIVRVRAVDAATGAAIEQPELAWRTGGEAGWTSRGGYVGLEALTGGATELRLPSGTLELAVAKAGFGYPFIVETLRVRADETTEHVARLTRVDPVVFVADPPPPRDVAIQVLAADDALGPITEIWRTDPFRLGPGWLKFDDGGRALVHGLPDASYVLVSELDLAPTRVAVGPDRSTPIELTWKRTR